MFKRKNKKGLAFGGIIILFIGIIFGLALLTPIFSSQNQMTDKQVAENQSVSVVTGYLTNETVNESINYSIYSQSDWKVIDCPISSVAIRNGAGTALVADTDYTLDVDNARFSLLTTAKTYPSTSLNLTYVDYTFCADGYINNSGGRGVTKLIGLFAAFALLAFVLEKSGVINLTGLSE